MILIMQIATGVFIGGFSLLTLFWFLAMGGKY